MFKKGLLFGLITVLFALLLIGCGTNSSTGNLQFYANGEDFVRKGLVSKDGWEINFDHLYITISDIKAYQTNPPFEVDSDKELEPSKTVELKQEYTVDLAEGNESANSILVAELKEIPIGHYNALSWNLVKAETGEAEGYSLVLIGQAKKEQEIVDFAISIDQEIKYLAGEYIGDVRKGFVTENETGDLEMTFHFDHLFGDNQLPADDEINLGSVGFEPFARIADHGKLIINMSELEQRLEKEDYLKLVEMIYTLGHVGEGHAHFEEF